MKTDMQEPYSGYSRDITGLSSNKLVDYLIRNSEYAYRFHFNKRNNYGRIIDFGGRIGEKTRRIKNVIVVEVDKEALKFMHENNIKCEDSIDKFDDESLDTIYCSHVLEHLINPSAYLEKFYKKLRRGEV